MSDQSSYLHDLDPVIIRITDDFALNWYGFSYMLAFVSAWLLLSWMGKKQLWPIVGDKLSEFIFGVAVFGVLIGGRVGYVLFYMIPNNGLDTIMANFWQVAQVWKGGMSFHGGLLGVIIYTIFYARKNKLNFLVLGDGLSVVAPIGLFFGRIANFINGELYGRTTDVSWGMKFPLEIRENPALQQQVVNEVAEKCPKEFYDYLSSTNGQTFGMIDWIMESMKTNPQIADAVADVLPIRHPSQLYEAGLEGLLIFVVLFTLRIKFSKLSPGWLTGLLLVMYAGARIFVENYREPDSPLVGAMTRGQFLSLFMILIGAWCIFSAWKKSRNEAQPKE